MSKRDDVLGMRKMERAKARKVNLTREKQAQVRKEDNRINQTMKNIHTKLPQKELYSEDI